MNNKLIRKYFLDICCKNIVLFFFLFLITLGLVLPQFFSFKDDFDYFLASWFGLTVLLLLFTKIIPALVISNRANKAFKISKYAKGISTLSISDQEIIIELGSTKTKEVISVEDFKIIEITRNCILAIVNNTDLLIVLQNTIDKDHLTSLINSSRQQTLVNPYKLNLPPYYIFLPCLIPFIGGIMGIVSICLGLFTYKNKILTAIGVMGICLSIVTGEKIVKRYSNMVKKVKS